MYVEQISVYIENMPGSAAAVTKVLAENGVNIRAVLLSEIKALSSFHLIVDNPAKGFEVLKKAHFTVSSVDVVAVRVGDEPGDFNYVLELLADHNYNVEYAYFCLSKMCSGAIAILKVEDTSGESLQMLKEFGISVLEPNDILA